MGEQRIDRTLDSALGLRSCAADMVLDRHVTPSRGGGVGRREVQRSAAVGARLKRRLGAASLGWT